MKRGGRGFLQVLAALLALALALSAVIFLDFGAETAPVRLPETVEATPPAQDGSGGNRLLVEVNPDTVQAVVATLVRPDSYARSISVETFWAGGSRRYRIQSWQKNDAVRVTVQSDGLPDKHCLSDESGLLLWYGSDTAHVYRRPAGAEADVLQMLPTYESLLTCDRAAIREAGYVRQGRSWYIRTAVETDADRLEICCISIDTGLLESAERWEGNRLVYRMEAGEADLSAPAQEIFRSPLAEPAS